MMLELQAYHEMRQRPPAAPAMRHTWKSLLFVHTAVDPELVQRTLPPELTVDTFPDATGRERAWLGVVPFTMHDVRFEGMPPIPGHSRFPETNVRTYVHREGRNPGIWFYSLDATKWLVCEAARLSYGLPYRLANMRVEVAGPQEIDYTLRRIEEPHAEMHVRFRYGGPAVPCEPGSLEFFLVERYLLYSHHLGKLRDGLVHHRPYLIAPAEVLAYDSTLTSAAGLPDGPIDHVCYCPGVDVEVWALAKPASAPGSP